MAQQLSIFLEPLAPESAGPAVDWARRLVEATVAPDWQPLLHPFWASATGQQLLAFVQQRAQAGAAIYPPQPLRALQLTPLAQVRVVILGQDPYHGPGQAEGLAFSVPAGQRLLPSLRNIFKEILREQGLPLCAMPASGSLLHWAAQGVLLLNTTLTVEDGQPASHAKQGWETLTDQIIAACGALPHPVAFLFWGAHAQAKISLIDASRHLVLQANHPSPLSAMRGPTPFMGCGHFGQVNRWLDERSDKNIIWLEESRKTVA
jgi:uracil-DNA glycosylase